MTRSKNKPVPKREGTGSSGYDRGRVRWQEIDQDSKRAERGAVAKTEDDSRLGTRSTNGETKRGREDVESTTNLPRKKRAVTRVGGSTSGLRGGEIRLERKRDRVRRASRGFGKATAMLAEDSSASENEEPAKKRQKKLIGSSKNVLALNRVAKSIVEGAGGQHPLCLVSMCKSGGKYTRFKFSLFNEQKMRALYEKCCSFKRGSILLYDCTYAVPKIEDGGVNWAEWASKWESRHGKGLFVLGDERCVRGRDTEDGLYQGMDMRDCDGGVRVSAEGFEGSARRMGGLEQGGSNSCLLVVISAGCPRGFIDLCTVTKELGQVRGYLTADVPLKVWELGTLHRCLLVPLCEVNKYREVMKGKKKGEENLQFHIIGWQHTEGRAGFGETRRAAQLLGASLGYDRIIISDGEVVAYPKLTKNLLTKYYAFGDNDYGTYAYQTGNDKHDAKKLKKHVLEEGQKVKTSLRRPEEQLVIIHTYYRRYKGTLMGGKEDWLFMLEGELKGAIPRGELKVFKGDGGKRQCEEYSTTWLSYIEELHNELFPQDGGEQESNTNYFLCGGQLDKTKTGNAKIIARDWRRCDSLVDVVRHYYPATTEANLWVEVGRALSLLICEYKTKGGGIRSKKRCDIDMGEIDEESKQE